MNETDNTLLKEIEAAARLVHRVMPATAQYSWPLLNARAGREVWVKHENHTPIGAFKLRGGIVYMDRLRQSMPGVQGVIAATRGNHGQSVAIAARIAGLAAVVVVPEGNNPEKTAAIAAQGAEVIVAGDDFQEAVDHAQALASERGLHFVPAFHPWLVQGVASWALELLLAVPDLDTLYVPIGMGSAICGAIAVRDALGLPTRIVGVVAEGAPAYADSFWGGRVMTTNGAFTIADGLACRTPDPVAVGIIGQGADRVVTVSDDEIMAAMRHYFTDTHNLAEGAGAAALAALLADPPTGKAGVMLSGGNVDAALFQDVLEGDGH